MAMRQIAVLPYRTEGPAIDAPIQILLVSSRGTGRWVIPKGRPESKLTPHASAAKEAEEEAGVLGATEYQSIGFGGQTTIFDRTAISAQSTWSNATREGLRGGQATASISTPITQSLSFNASASFQTPRLSLGGHLIQAKAIDAAGNTDASQARKKVKILRKRRRR